jgi:hypothetical protein
MKVQYHTVDIRRSELSVIRLEVAAWEVSLLEALHGLAGVTKVSTAAVEVDDVPDASSEYKRLGDRYGVEIHDDGGRGDPMVEAVYGKHATGVMNLQRAIDAAVTA